MMAKLNAHHEKNSRMDSHVEKMEAAVDVFEERLNEMDTTDLEGNREYSEAVAEKQDVPKGEAAVANIGPLVDQYGDRHLYVRPDRQPQKQTQGYCGSRRKLPAARRRLTRRAIPSLRKGHEEPIMEERSGTDVGRFRNATTAYGTEA
jgi:hypothetical protein